MQFPIMLPDTVNDLFAQQHGCASRIELRLHGLTDGQIDSCVRRGSLVPLHRGVYAVPGSPDTRLRRLWAATRTTEPPGVVSHRAAASIYGYHLMSDSPLELSVVRERRPRVPGITIHQSRDLHPTQVSTIDGLHVTSPTRVLVDLGQVEPWWVVEKVLEHFLVQRLTTVPQVRAARELHSQHGRRGVGVLGHVLDKRALGDSVGDSGLESLVANVCAEAELDGLEFQHPIRLNGRDRRIDFAVPDLKIAIEIDGYEFHSGRAQFEADRVRENELVLAGWHVLRFTRNQVVYRREYVVQTIRSAIRR